MEDCKKSSTKELVKRLRYNNLLGLNESLRHGNLRGGKMNAEMLEMKRQFPHEVLLYRYYFVFYNMQHRWHPLLMKLFAVMIPSHHLQNVIYFAFQLCCHSHLSFCYLDSVLCTFQC